MRNARRRAELLYLYAFVACCVSVADDPKYKNVQLPHYVLARLSKEFKENNINDRELLDGINKANARIARSRPPGFMFWPPDLRLWYASKVCRAAIQRGWELPRTPVALEFIQRLYDAALYTEPASPQLIFDDSFFLSIIANMESEGLFT
jgi:hypothetical protein